MKEEKFNICNPMRNENRIKYYSNNNSNEKILKNYFTNIKEIKMLKKSIDDNKKNYYDELDILEKEILNFKNKLSSIKMPKCKYSQKDIEQILIKQKIVANAISVFKEEFESIKENLFLLEEEYNNCSFKLINIISMKDNFELIVKENTKYIFKNLIISYDQNTGESVSSNLIEEKNDLFFINNKNNFIIEPYDVNNIQNLPKFSNYIYKILSSNITSLIIEKNIKSLIFSSIEENFYDFIENKILDANNFIKKIAYNIVTSDYKIHNFIILPRFELLLKYIIKIFSYEKMINDFMKFIKEDYLYNKNILQKKYLEIKSNIQNYTKEKIHYNTKYNIMRKEYEQKMECLNEIEKIKNEIDKNEEKIKKEKIIFHKNETQYQIKINKLEKINKSIDDYLKGDDILKTINNVQENIKCLSKKINNNNSIIEFESKELCNITDINNEKLNSWNKKQINSNCYIHITNLSNNIEFDPLENYNVKPETKGFNKSLISLENNDINIVFNQMKEEISIIINRNNIKNIIIHPNMKKIIHYITEFKNKDKNNIQLLLKVEKEKGNNEINFDELIKCIYNKYFCLSIVLSNEKKINIIFLTYSIFKTWLKILDELCENHN